MLCGLILRRRYVYLVMCAEKRYFFVLFEAFTVPTFHISIHTYYDPYDMMCVYDVPFQLFRKIRSWKKCKIYCLQSRSSVVTRHVCLLSAWCQTKRLRSFCTDHDHKSDNSRALAQQQWNRYGVVSCNNNKNVIFYFFFYYSREKKTIRIIKHFTDQW